MRVEVPAPEYHLLIFSVSSRLLSIECLSYPSEMSSYSTFPDLATSDVVNHLVRSFSAYYLEFCMIIYTCQFLSTFHHPNVWFLPQIFCLLFWLFSEVNVHL